MKFEERKLKDLCTVITDGSHLSPKASEEGYKMLSVKDMGELDFKYEEAKLINEKDYLKLVKNGCKPMIDDVLIAKDGNSCLESCFVMREDKEVVLLSSIAILRPNKEKINPYYLMYVLKSESIKNDLKKNHVSGSAIPRMILKDFREYTIKFPDIEYQNKIVDYLYTLDLKIELNKEIIDNIEKFSSLFYKRWFIDFEFPTEHGNPYNSSGGKMIESDLGEIPEGWKIEKLDDISKVRIGKTPPRKEVEWFSDNENDVKWVSIKDMGNSNSPYIIKSSEKLTNEAIKKFKINIVPQNTVIMSFKLTIGRLNITEEELTTNEAIASFLLEDSSMFSEFLYLALKNYNFNSLGNTSSIGTAVNSKVVKSMKIIVPSNEILNQTKAQLIPLFKLMKAKSKENYELTKLRDSLLPKLLSGEIEVPVLEPEKV